MTNIIIDQVKRFKGFVVLVLLCFSVSGCEIGPGLPPELAYAVVKFKEETYKDCVLTEPYQDGYLVFTYGSSERDFMGYVDLNSGYCMSKQLVIPSDCALSGKKWVDYSVAGCGIKFVADDIVDTHPLLSYYWIPESRLGVERIEAYPSPEAIDSINALIDDSRIERYGVDLGY